MKVNPLDLSAQYRSIRSEVQKAVKEVLDSQRYVLGPNVSAFEDEIAVYSGARHAVGVASGTDALLLALMAAGVERGDRVVTTPYSFFATASSIARLGAEPVFVDIDPETYNIDPDAVARLLKRRSARVKALIPVHLYGQSADMNSIKSTAAHYGLKVVEDAAQSIGATYGGKSAGSMGDFGCFSFYPSKNLGGMGDGGMVTTSSKKLADSVRMLRVHGARDRYHHTHVGINSRLDELQAVVLRVKLKYLDRWTEKRIEVAARYDRLFRRAGLDGVVKPPKISSGNRSVFNQYVVRVSKRNSLKEFLAAKGVGTAIYYPIPLHLQECFKGLGYKRGDLPVSEKAARETLALPMYPELKVAEQKYVVSSITDFYGN